ncbi:MAG: LUD domain-containing protein, partial [Planctomycetota bacterium]
MTSTIPYHQRAEAAVADVAWSSHHDRSVWHVREKRDAAAASVSDWEALRDHAAAIKRHVVSELPRLVGEFASQARAAGWQVHFAADAVEFRAIADRLLSEAGARRVVKSKSMLTEECGLNKHLHARGIQVVDTDLGERIVQMRREPPSHIVLPAIHLKRSDIGDTFHRELGTPAGEEDPERLTRAARVELREHMLQADAGITGVNFAIAETGGIVVCTNEGNADLGSSLPPLTIACMGVEKLIPKQEDLAVFLRL